MTDFITDNNRVSQITTGPILSPDPFWNGFDPDDIEVSLIKNFNGLVNVRQNLDKLPDLVLHFIPNF